MNMNLTKRLVTLGVTSLFAVTALTGCGSEKPVEPTPTPETNGTGTAQQTSPMGERKMISFNGDRYVFLNNGEVFALNQDQVGTEVAKQNDGTLFALKGYNPEFRMAFQYNDAFYICENVGKADDSAIDIAAYFAKANLQQHVIFADIFDHMGGNILNGLDQETAIKLLDAFAQAKVATLTTEQHEAIAKAQSEGLSYRVDFTLEDHTSFTSYVIPSMNYITVGDYTCELDNLEAKIGSYFENLVASENIIMN